MLNIGLLHFPLLPLSLVSLLFTPLLPLNPIYHQLSHKRMFIVTNLLRYGPQDYDLLYQRNPQLASVMNAQLNALSELN